MSSSDSGVFERIADLNEYGLAFNQCSDTDEVAEAVVDAVADLFEVECAWYVDGTDGGLEVVHHSDPIADADVPAVARQAHESGEPVSVALDDPESITAVATPATIDGSVTAVVVAHASETEQFDVEYGDPLGILASHAATAVKNIRTRKRLEAQKAELERQNERLEDFASVVSHDLRSPLTLAQGQLDLARTHGDEEFFDTLQDALNRMNELIEQILTLARNGQTLTETEMVDVVDVSEMTWEYMDTDEATLDLQTTRTVTADEERLFHLFENLFRNAIDHGSQDVTITVGDCGDGFYVADDGTGIPEEIHEDVFEKGFTTAEDGTGFGLAIARTITDSHGWSIDVTHSQSGGARFEITGITETDECPLETDGDSC